MKPPKAPPYLADFDSASAMLRATARFLRGEDFPQLGRPRMPEPLAELLGLSVDALPLAARQLIYSWSGALEASPRDKIPKMRGEALARWVVGEYPPRPYPAAFIGSSNGALVHLCAALGVPWLPQTFLLPIKARLPEDEPKRAMEAMREPGQRLLANNPELTLHHMHDPSQDRLMLKRMAYFRVKRRRLGAAYTQFLTARLMPGATIFIVDCGKRWPTTQVAERHIFQFGAVGGPTIEEYFSGGPRVANYLRRMGSTVRCWDAPPPDGERPEAEWGFDAELLGDITRLAERQGYRVRRVTFTDPMVLSVLVADLYRWWYARLGLPTNRLIVDSFILMEPFWTQRTASIPFWMTFNMRPGAERLGRYLDASPAFDEIALMLFSHGVRSVGLASIPRWRSLLERARRRGDFLGVNTRAYPADFATFVRYYTDLRATIPADYTLPPSLTLAELDAFLGEHPGQYDVQWRDETPAREPHAPQPV